MNEKLSVITITYNNDDELSATLSSIADQNVESIVVNGGSSQETILRLQSHWGKILSEKDNGISDAFNKGIKLASGEYLVFLNSGDVLIDKEYYREAIEVFKRDWKVDFVYADLRYIDVYAGEIRTKSNHPFPNMPFMHPTLIVRSNVFKKIGAFDLKFKIAMDLDFAYRLVRSGSKGYYIPRMVVQMDGAGVSSTRFSQTYVENVRAILKNRDWSLRSLFFVVKNGVFLFFKLLLLRLGGDKLLGLYRKKKYSP